MDTDNRTIETRDLPSGKPPESSATYVKSTPQAARINGARNDRTFPVFQAVDEVLSAMFSLCARTKRSKEQRRKCQAMPRLFVCGTHRPNRETYVKWTLSETRIKNPHGDV